ncbi:hypothetical protein H0H81_007853 [Sphagnurus paluster]|uniref:Uncharacterized protein n=1 Tax=Sphagnurus paluster TaxID=117069 RepID=A0A9P7FWQ5_9AGAR|nr:hypothetical protein H0H81_007853 [Sphagnurus paluster]
MPAYASWPFFEGFGVPYVLPRLHILCMFKFNERVSQFRFPGLRLEAGMLPALTTITVVVPERVQKFYFSQEKAKKLGVELLVLIMADSVFAQFRSLLILIYIFKSRAQN